jgi:hypothetical protein
LLAAFRLSGKPCENLLIECLRLSRFIAQGEHVRQFGLALLNFCGALVFACVAKSQVEVLFCFGEILVDKVLFTMVVNELPVGFDGKGR